MPDKEFYYLLTSYDKSVFMWMEALMFVRVLKVTATNNHFSKCVICGTG